MLKLRKTTPGEPLILAMTALRMGDRLLVMGCAEPKGVALFATKVGLTGRACAVDEDMAHTASAAQAAERQGALLETFTAPVTMLPFDHGSFDVVIVHHLLRLVQPDRRVAALAEAARVLRTGGRCVVVEASRRGGLAALFGGGSSLAAGDVEALMSSAVFRGVRTLAGREGLVFVEGGKR